MEPKSQKIELRKQSNFVIIGFFAFLFLYLSIRFSWPLGKDKGLLPNDFLVLFKAVERLQNSEAIYQPTDSSPFKYSPAFALWFQWLFAPWGPAKAWFLYCVSTLSLWLISVFWIVRETLSARIAAFSISIVLGLIAGWHGIIEHLAYGQSDFLIISMYSIAFIFRNRLKALSILLIGIALLIKPQSLMLTTPFALTGNPLIVLYGGLSSIMILAATCVPSWGWDRTLLMCRQWLESLGQQPADLFGSNLNHNLGAAIYRVLHSAKIPLASAEPFAKVTALIGITITAAVWLQSWRNQRQNGRLFAWITPVRALTIGYGLHLCASPLSWRWITFLWWPMAIVSIERHRSLAIYREERFKTKRDKTRFAALLFFFVCVTLLQTMIAHAIGIREIDDLSYWGFYAWGNLAITISLIL